MTDLDCCMNLMEGMCDRLNSACSSCDDYLGMLVPYFISFCSVLSTYWARRKQASTRGWVKLGRHEAYLQMTSAAAD